MILFHNEVREHIGLALLERIGGVDVDACARGRRLVVIHTGGGADSIGRSEHDARLA